jgi:hypothetical protein
MAGHVVHVALERIVGAVGASVRNEDSDTQSPATPSRFATSEDTMALIVRTLKLLGGVSAVLELVLEDTVSDWLSNPRLAPRAQELIAELRRQLPALRQRVQQFLGRLDLAHVRHSAQESDTRDSGGPTRPLSPGVYAEVPLVNDDLGWFGKADLLRIGDPVVGEADEIIDFKTGSPKDDHALQLRIYALLWAKEKNRNPTGRRVTRLTVLYPTGAADVPAPFTDEEVTLLTDDLITRTEKAYASIRQAPPVATPSREACEWCDVRHMCTAYWAPLIPGGLAQVRDQSRDEADVELHVLASQAAWSWQARVEAVGALSGELPNGARVLVRARPHDTHLASLLMSGTRVRVLGARLLAPSDESGGLPVLGLLRSTEVFVVGDAR